MTRPRLQAVIGLEIHAQLLSKRKLFSPAFVPRCNALPNTSVTFYDAACPGTLPSLHVEPVRLAVRAGLALNCTINRKSRFVRKHYFYCDMPAGYQITQQEQPIVSDGVVSLDDGTSVRIDRIQLEQDSGKTVTDLDSNFSFLDLNRAGVPLIEIVTAPDINDSNRAVQVVKKVHHILSYLDICDGVMANGDFRVDVNVSMKDLENSEASGYRVEVKNLNSFKSIRRAIDYEIERQTELMRKGCQIFQETRGFDASLGVTQVIRSKEFVKDYRMFNDPDLPVLSLSEEFISEIAKSLPELPEDASQRLQSEHKLSSAIAQIISSDRDVLRYFEQIMLVRPAHTDTATAVCKWMINELFGRLTASNLPFSANPVKAAQFRDLVDMVQSGSISGSAAKSILNILMEGKHEAVAKIVSERGWSQISDPSVLRPACLEVIQSFPKEVSDYLVKGNQRKLNFLIGEARKRLGDQASMNSVKTVLIDLLNNNSNDEQH